MSNKNEIDKQQFEKVISSSNSKSDICRALGFPINSWGLNKVMELIKKFNLNIDHFDKNKWYKRKYLKVERKCSVCDTIFIVSDGSKKQNKKFCSYKCANSIGRNRKAKEDLQKCLVCENKVKYSTRIFCSQICRARYSRLKTFERIENGTFNHNGKGNGKNQLLKLYLIEKNGYKCFICGLTEWMGKPIPLQLDHKDGDSDNDDVENIRNVCPNCHAQTPTYCGKNKGNGKRKHRLKDYHDGKKKW